MAKKAEKSTAEGYAGSGDYVIETGSASDVTKDIARKYNISVVPIYIHLEGKEFKGGIDIDSNRIYKF